LTLPVLVAAVVVVGALGLVNLLFSFGVIRRLREHTETLSVLRQGGGIPSGPMLDAGATIGDFTTRTVDGELVTLGDLDTMTLVGVFSPECSSCEKRVEPFLAYAATHPGGRGRTLAVVVGTTDATQSYVRRLTPRARVVVEEADGEMSEAFGVRGYPAFALIDGGQVRASGSDPETLAATVS
jgi:hypothetical protein